METLDDAQRARVAAYWWQRAEGEITSWVGFRHVLEDLRAEGSPSLILEQAERAVEDEYKHALFCRDWAVHFGRTEKELPEPRSVDPITFRGAAADENRVLRIVLCGFTETVGCFILRHVRPALTNPALRKLNRQHLADELRHSRVGWGYLATLDPNKKAWLRLWLPDLLEVCRRACSGGPEQDWEELVPFGYFTPRLLRAAYDQALAEVVDPGLAYLGLTESSLNSPHPT